MTWLVGFALLVPGWILQAMALDPLVVLGMATLEERLAPPAWHKAVAFTALGCAFAASAAISRSVKRGRARGDPARIDVAASDLGSSGA